MHKDIRISISQDISRGLHTDQRTRKGLHLGIKAVGELSLSVFSFYSR